MTSQRQRTLGIALIALGLAGVLGTAWVFGALPDPSRLGTWGPFGAARSTACAAPALPGATVDVTLSDMGMGMMGGRRMMNVGVSPSLVTAGSVSFRVWNAGFMVHELVVLPATAAVPGSRPVGSDGTVDETGSLGEASTTCGPGAGSGIAPGAVSWVTIHLGAGRYELVCNLPGHYARGMFAELDAR